MTISLKTKQNKKQTWKITYDLEEMLVNFSLHYFQEMGSKGPSRAFNYVLECVEQFFSLRCTIFYLGLFFKCIEVRLNISGYLCKEEAPSC